MEHISSKENLEQIVQEFTHNTDKIWFKHSKIINITKHLKSLWNEEYQRKLKKYRILRYLENWKTFSKVWSRKPNKNFSMLKTRKLQVKIVVLGN